MCWNLKWCYTIIKQDMYFLNSDVYFDKIIPHLDSENVHKFTFLCYTVIVLYNNIRVNSISHIQFGGISLNFIGSFNFKRDVHIPKGCFLYRFMAPFVCVSVWPFSLSTSWWILIKFKMRCAYPKDFIFWFFTHLWPLCYYST